MNDTRFTHALNIVLMLDEGGCLKQGGDLTDPINNQELGKQCNKQIKAILIIYEFLLQLYPEKPDENNLKQENPISDRHYLHFGDCDIN
ncbi:MAG TPA: hypothetical protein VIF37_11380 [Methylobacter sp.]